MKIGMIGLGAMGFPITKCLLKAGFEVYAFDVAEKTLDEAAANGAHPCPDVAKVGAEAETILDVYKRQGEGFYIFESGFTSAAVL